MITMGNLYNLDAFRQFLSSANALGFTDSLGGVVLSRSLEQIDPRIFEKQFPELALMNSGISINNEGGFSLTITSLRIVDEGGFRNASNTATNKGRIDIKGEQNQISVIDRSADSAWDERQLRRAQLQDINLPQRFVAAHNKIYLRELDESGLLGFGSNEGLLTFTGFTTDVAAGVIGSLTGEEQYNEFRDLITNQWSAVENTPAYKADRVMMPTSVFNTIGGTFLNTAGTELSVLRALQLNFPSVMFLNTFRQPVSGPSVTVAFSTDSESMVMRVPVTLQIGEIVKISSFNFIMDSMYNVAGLDVLDDTSGRRLTGL